MSMAKNERTQAEIPHQDKRDLSCRVLFSSPRGKNTNDENPREKMRSRRCSHGVARAIENLRRVRLSLVPPLDSTWSVLPWL